MEPRSPSNSPAKSAGILWVGALVLFIAALTARAAKPEWPWLAWTFFGLLVLDLAEMVRRNRRTLRTRSVAYGLNSFVTVLLVLGLLAVANFFIQKNPISWDLTKNKIHSLSDQSVKLVKELKGPIKAVMFARTGEREKLRPLLDRYRAANPAKFELEFVDFDREVTRVRGANIRKPNTLQLQSGAKTQLVDDPTEEKITNSLIKITKEAIQNLCVVTGHGEKVIANPEAEGLELWQKSIKSQAYDVQELNLLKAGKVPDNCDSLAIVGPTKPFLAAELETLSAYLSNGGRALIAVDPDVKGGEFSPELLKILEKWYVKPTQALIVDPSSRRYNTDAAVAIAASFATDQAVTRDFHLPVYCPISRPLEILPNVPAGLKVDWLVRTMPTSFAVTDFKQLATGQVTQNAKDKAGPFTVGAVADGKQPGSVAKRNTRLVVLGTSSLAANFYIRFGGNMDFLLNSVAWLMEDESLISIRAREDESGKVEISQRAGALIELLTIYLLPLLIAAAGIGVWAYRRRL